MKLKTIAPAVVFLRFNFNVMVAKGKFSPHLKANLAFEFKK